MNQKCDEHNVVCLKMENLESELKDNIWPVIRSRLSSRVFYWVTGGICALMLLVAGWFGKNLDARSDKLTEVDKAVAVIQSDVRHSVETMQQIHLSIGKLDRKIDRMNGKDKDD